MSPTCRPWPRALLPVALFAAATGSLPIAVLELPLGVFRLLAGVVLVAVAPGYALLLALFGDSDLRRQLAWSVPISLALTVLIGMVVSLARLSLAGPALLVGNWAGTAVLFGISTIRASITGGAPSTDPQPRPESAQEPASRPGAWGLLAGVLAVTLSVAWAGAQVRAASQPYVTPFSSLAFEASEREYAQLTLENHEVGATTYRLEIDVDGITIGRWVGFELARGARQTFLVPTGSGRVEARLYRGGETEPYRRVWAGERQDAQEP
jgi:hypothetical protein